MNDDLTTRVVRAVRNPDWGKQTVRDDAELAILAVIEWLAERASSQDLTLGEYIEIAPYVWETRQGGEVADWIRAQAEANGDGDAPDV